MAKNHPTTKLRYPSNFQSRLAALFVEATIRAWNLGHLELSHFEPYTSDAGAGYVAKCATCGAFVFVQPNGVTELQIDGQAVIDPCTGGAL